MNQLSKKVTSLHIPLWLAIIYAALAGALLPWTINLSSTLPVRHVSLYWDVAWVGFDLILFSVVLATAYFALKKSGWVILSAMATSALLVADAWLDIWTSRPGRQMNFAIIIAIFVELPLALMSFWLAYRVSNQLIAKK